MTNPSTPRLPHHSFLVYQVAVELLVAVRESRISDATLRSQALRAAKSTALNCAEAAGRTSRADKARVLGIARGEAVETIAAVEIAVHAGDAPAASADRVLTIGHRLLSLLGGFLRH